MAWNLTDTNLFVFPIEESLQSINIASGQQVLSKNLPSINTAELNVTGDIIALGHASGKTTIHDVNTFDMITTFGEGLRINYGYDQITSVDKYIISYLLVIINKTSRKK